LPSIIWTARPDGTIDFANQRWYDYSGLSYADTKNMRWEILVHERDLPTWQNAWAEALEFGKTAELEMRILSADGTYRWHATRIVPIKDEKERITMIAGSMFETQKFHDAQRQAQETEQRFTRLLDTVKEYALFMLDGEGKVMTWNKGAENLHGWGAYEIIGKPYEILFPEKDRKEGRPAKILKAVMSRGNYHEEGWRVRKDGTYFVADIVLTAVKNSEGQVTGFLKFSRDMTQIEHGEAMVKRLNQRNQLILDTVQEGICGIDEGGRISFVNAAAEKLFGWSFEELVGKNFHDIVHHTKADGSPFPIEECSVYKSLREKESQAGQEIMWAKDGTPLHLEYTSTPVLERGEVAGAVIVCRDIGERKNAAAQLQRSKEQLNVILQGVGDGITAVDRKGNIIYANSAAAKAIGYSSGEELVGANTRDIMTRFEVYDADGNLLSTEKRTAARALRGETIIGETFRVKALPTGEERWNVVSSQPVFDARGEVDFVINIFKDITESKKVNDAIHKNQERLRFLAEASASFSKSIHYDETLKSLAKSLVPYLGDWCGIDMLREDGSLDRVVVVHADPAKLAFAQEVRKIFPHDPNATTGLAQVLKTGKPEFIPNLTWEMITATIQDKEKLDIVRKLDLRSIIIVPLIARGKTLGAITLVMSESDRRYTESDLEFADDIASRAALAVDNARLYKESQHALALRDDFLSIASHELKTPVTSVKAFLQALEQRMGKPEQFDFKKNKEYMQLSIKQVDRLSSIINDLLDITRINKGNLEYNFKIMSIGPIVAEVVERMSVSFPSHIIACKLQDLTAKVRVDTLRFEQVLTNLITNAVKYSPPGSVIDVSTYSEGNQIFIAIKDQGMGISEDEQKLIFNRYYRTKDAISSKVSGIGIGLYIVSQLIEAHNGTLTVQSSQGRGSTFIISLPKAGGN
jgi:PAS domain S-box-containing protein